MTSAGVTADEIRRRFDAAPMSPAQVAAIAVTVALSALDGYDVLSVTFAAPAIGRDWNLGRAALGAVLSAGLVGMALGSLVLAPLADRVGRRRLMLVALALMATGMALSATAGTLGQLAAWRVLTGLGIGAMVAVINPVAAEFANAKRRPMALALMAVGYPAGGLLGGLLASVLLSIFGWRAVFAAGVVFAVLLTPFVLRFLPEPLAFLLARPKGDGLARVNGLLRRCRQPEVSAMPASARAKSGGYRAIFTPGQLSITARVTAANLLFVMVVYYVLSWLPQMVTDAGFAPASASLVAAVANLCGIVGGLTLGALARRVGLRRIAATMMAGLGFATAAFGLTPPSLPLLIMTAGICGFFLFGGIAGIYATLAGSYAVDARASGAGFVIGVGRIGSAVAPALAGLLFAGGFERGTVSIAFGALAVVAGLLLALGRTLTSESDPGIAARTA
ncbi:MFS transporter [uncultured Sphingomonas sp.]|uniref:MFS transporter n=1 Tax=uncultured Sphingomonas sp. TaxID=158754 RepID=UPI0035C96740